MPDYRILLVEDESIVALDVRDRLERMGYTIVGVAAYGEDAISKAAEMQPDLVLMDVQLRGEMDGIEAARYIRESSGIPVIYMTAYADEETLQRAKVTGPSGYIVKPFEERELHATIEMALYKHSMETKLRDYAHSLERANRQLALVNRLIAASADGMDERAVVEVACQELAQILGVPYVVAGVLDRDGTTARVVGGFEREGKLAAVGRTVQIGDTSLMQEVLAQGQPVVIDDPESDSRLASLKSGMGWQQAHTLLLLPLVTGHHITGGMALATTGARRFSDQDVELAWTVAKQLTGALSRIQLNQERQRLTAAIEQAAESVIITDAEGTILYVNPAFERITGYTQAEVVGKNPRLLKSGVQDAQFYADLWQTLRTGKVWHGQLANRKRDGSLFIAEANIAPVRGDRGEGVVNYVSVQRDVTQELRKEEQYRQALKMEAVGRLAAGIAHDFNNLLTAINGYASLLVEEDAIYSQHRKMAGEILGAGERAADLTRQLLDFSRKQIVQPEVLNLNDTVQNMSNMLQRTIGEHIVLESALAPDLWPVNVDLTQMQRAIVNLAVNARDAMDHGGCLTIRTENVVLDKRQSTFGLDVLPGEYVLLAVEDTGEGMSEETKAHLFEPFFTTKDVGKGTGLGLATVYGIVKQARGTVRVESTVGQGSIFELYLPRAQSTAALSREEERRLEEVHQGKETILLVEDNESVRNLTGRVLQKQGYALIQARNGAEAQRVATGHPGRVHLLLTDVIMPGGTGKALADDLTQVWPDLKVIFMSGYADEAIGKHGVLAPGVEFLSKPFTPVDLARKVRSVLDRGH
jgi:PAS domain S-box-containing protein